MTNAVKIKELSEVINHIISNNQILQENGKMPIALEIQGESGIGKTSVVIQIAEELGLEVVKINLAQIEDPGDLAGFPLRQVEYNMEDGSSMWVDEFNIKHMLETHSLKPTGRSRTAYCPPKWVDSESKGGILLLDDWNRGDGRMLQAVMELIDRQEYSGWKLPKNWHIILTSNPDNGEYLVNSIDNAQRTRFITVNLAFDVKEWAYWADRVGVDSRCINFLLLNPELASQGSNSRTITTFFNSISCIEEFSKKLLLIQTLGEGSVGLEFASVFTSFVHNKLDQLIGAQNIMEMDEAYVFRTLKSLIGTGDDYRADIASTLGLRLKNYLILYKGSFSKPMQERLMALLNSDVFTVDIIYNMMLGIFEVRQKDIMPLLSHPKVINLLVGSTTE